MPPADPVNAELLSRRNQLYDALTRCMTVQQLDALLADADNRAAMDEMWVVGIKLTGPGAVRWDAHQTAPGRVWALHRAETHGPTWRDTDKH